MFQLKLNATDRFGHQVYRTLPNVYRPASVKLLVTASTGKKHSCCKMFLLEVCNLDLLKGEGWNPNNQIFTFFMPVPSHNLDFQRHMSFTIAHIIAILLNRSLQRLYLRVCYCKQAFYLINYSVYVYVKKSHCLLTTSTNLGSHPNT
jgi:hypothetical protein